MIPELAIYASLPWRITAAGAYYIDDDTLLTIPAAQMTYVTTIPLTNDPRFAIVGIHDREWATELGPWYAERDRIWRGEGQRKMSLGSMYLTRLLVDCWLREFL